MVDWTHSVTTDANGKATIEGVTAGELTILVAKRGYQAYQGTITVGENATSFSITLNNTPAPPDNPPEEIIPNE